MKMHLPRITRRLTGDDHIVEVIDFGSEMPVLQAIFPASTTMHNAMIGVEPVRFKRPTQTYTSLVGKHDPRP